jgi:hypothetical protein
MRVFFVTYLLLSIITSHAQKQNSGGFITSPMRNNAQYPGIMRNAYVGVDLGYIDCNFTSAQLEPGFTATGIKVPHPAVKITLWGKMLNEWLSAHITYMRPVDWVQYKNVNGDNANHSVWMNVGGLTLQSQLLIGKAWSWRSEAGLALVTRRGFRINDVPVVKDANYGTWLVGSSFQYHFDHKWELCVTGMYSPRNKNAKQPSTLFLGAGFRYTMRHFNTKGSEYIPPAGGEPYRFAKHLLQVGYSTNVLGYGVNNAVSKGPVPVFWGGDAEVRRGFTLHYQRNIFHTRKVFSFDWGASASWWKSDKAGNEFYTLSLFPLLRFTAFRWTGSDIYFNYSVAGPTYISQTIIDGHDTGKHFTFQDFMGVGVNIGKKRHLNTELRIAHYSNGNIFPQNTGVKIPLTFNFGYSF